MEEEVMVYPTQHWNMDLANQYGLSLRLCRRRRLSFASACFCFICRSDFRHQINKSELVRLGIHSQKSESEWTNVHLLAELRVLPYRHYFGEEDLFLCLAAEAWTIRVTGGAGYQAEKPGTIRQVESIKKNRIEALKDSAGIWMEDANSLKKKPVEYFA